MPDDALVQCMWASCGAHVTCTPKRFKHHANRHGNGSTRSEEQGRGGNSAPAAQPHTTTCTTRSPAHACVRAGFWLENLTDMLITLAFPTVEEFGATFAIIFASRVIENMAYLGFQLDIWFKFRIWIKGKFKKDQV